MLRLRWFHFTVVPCDAPYEGFITGGSLPAAPLNEAKFLLNTVLQIAIKHWQVVTAIYAGVDTVLWGESVRICFSKLSSGSRSLEV